VLTYETLKKQPKELLALTGLARREVEALLPVFESALRAAEEKTAPKAKKRQRAPGAGRKPALATVEDKLLFVLVYTKTYPLQVVHGQLFAMSQSSANEWLHCLLPVLATALDALGVSPEREGHRLAQRERRQEKPHDLIVDGVERCRQRPQSKQKQALHYSGKKKGHYDKNIVVVATQSKRVSFLSQTKPGSMHDKAIVEEAEIHYPRDCILRSDLGFQGYHPRVGQNLQPKKSRGNRNCHRARNAATGNSHGCGCA
jgi:Helix-turn-helix of DDE superfamily endonuclease/DDE superfamily endonuclease